MRNIVKAIILPTLLMVAGSVWAAPNNEILNMLSRFMTYADSIWVDCDTPTANGLPCGYYRASGSPGQSNEDGVRSNADHAMVAAFMWSEARPLGIALPQGITYEGVHRQALEGLTYGLATHKANATKQTTDGRYWGSTSATDHTWESSLWAMSLCYAAYFLDSELTPQLRQMLFNMVKAECDYELQRQIPTGYRGDTKAEENGWETNILSCALGLYPDHELAPQWYERLREFAINCYSHATDAADLTVVDPQHDSSTVASLHRGVNLYDDYTLQNHNYFHTSYQNVVVQELGESALALKLFQGANPKWSTNALMHNNQAVMDNVLSRLALSDGELAMPNGNDWSMFLFDQITSYATLGCILNDPDALMLEGRALANIKRRQLTTADGSWLLNSDIGARRMGVQAHRMMMTWLLHREFPPTVKPSTWDDFARRVGSASVFECQEIVRAMTPSRFSIFSWSEGLRSYTGYFVPNDSAQSKVLVPYRRNNTGNLLGWYEVAGHRTNAVPAMKPTYEFDGNAYVMNGGLITNDSTLCNNFAIYSTSGNALIYVDCVTALSTAVIERERGGVMAISTDPFTKPERKLTWADGSAVTDGSESLLMAGRWVNVDNAIAAVTDSQADGVAGFGDRELQNSVISTKLTMFHGNQQRTVRAGDTVDRRAMVCYSSIDAATTALLADQMQSLRSKLNEGWNGVIAADPDGVRYMLLANFGGDSQQRIEGVTTEIGAPVFAVPTTITAAGSTATFDCEINSSIAQPLTLFVSGGRSIEAVQEADGTVSLTNTDKKVATIKVTTAVPDTMPTTTTHRINKGETIRLKAPVWQ